MSVCNLQENEKMWSNALSQGLYWRCRALSAVERWIWGSRTSAATRHDFTPCAQHRASPQRIPSTPANDLGPPDLLNHPFTGATAKMIKENTHNVTEVLSQPTKWLSMYSDFIIKNSSAVSQIESALRSLTYIIPGKN